MIKIDKLCTHIEPSIIAKTSRIRKQGTILITLRVNNKNLRLDKTQYETSATFFYKKIQIIYECPHNFLNGGQTDYQLPHRLKKDYASTARLALENFVVPFLVENLQICSNTCS